MCVHVREETGERERETGIVRESEPVCLRERQFEAQAKDWRETA